jgi:hypothetical protein
VATVSDKEGVFELLIPNSTRYDVHYKRNDHMGEADSLLNWTPIAKSEVGNWTEAGGAKVSSSSQTRDSHNRRPHGRRHGEDQTRTGRQNQRSKHSLRREATVQINVV